MVGNMISLKKLAEACDSVALDLKKGRIKGKQLRRSYVFFATGACGCAFGHVLARAGARPRLAPFSVRGAEGGVLARWTDNCGAFTAATGIEANDFDYGNPIASRLMDLEAANDLPGDNRKLAVCNALRDLAAVLRESA